jgi:hypothetical protein
MESSVPGRCVRLVSLGTEAYVSLMTKTAQALLEEARKLDVSERAELAAELLASLEGEPDSDVEAAWAAELRTRVERIATGDEELLDWDLVRDRIDKQILGR